MKRRTALMAAFLISIVVAISSIAYVIITISNTLTIKWSIKEQDQFCFSVQVSGYKSYFVNGTQNFRDPPYAHLNNSQITIIVTHLPEIPSQLDEDSFAKSIIEKSKTEIETATDVENTSNYLDPEFVMLNDLISHSLVPIGQWSTIDAFYPDEPEFPYACNTYLSKFVSDNFLIGHRYYNIDSGHGWFGIVSIDTGVPNNATLWARKMYGNEWFSYSIVLVKL